MEMSRLDSAGSPQQLLSLYVSLTSAHTVAEPLLLLGSADGLLDGASDGNPWTPANVPLLSTSREMEAATADSEMLSTPDAEHATPVVVHVPETGSNSTALH